ncbi:GFA domain-containing protein [Mycena indigotica]|uniref:GFA domain-containing protein n=1 Tax=Mycena indigotica TaxID=2126181 RepID=A0A8H6S1A8_9AGAR|nr:GFA domain-containing protein [Mycena indigotica]KAF7290201.1 GFA domain-containing protein [Mycena indigotica]
MPVHLKGSCHCGAVRFAVDSSSAVPYQLCVCSICRKVGGYGGSVNLGGHNATLQIEQGKEDIRVYRAVMDRDTPEERTATSERSFCGRCSSMLWLWSPEWPDLIHPFASAIDDPELVVPERMAVACAAGKPAYVRLPEGPKDVYDVYGPESLESWHKKEGLWVE